MEPTLAPFICHEAYSNSVFIAEHEFGISSLERMSFGRRKRAILEKSHFRCVTFRGLFRSVVPTLNQCSIHHSMQNWSLYTNQQQNSWGPWTSMSKYPKYSKNQQFQNRDFSSISCLVKCEQAHYGLIIAAWITPFLLHRMLYKPSSSHMSLKRYWSNTELGRKCTFFIRHWSCLASLSSKEHFETRYFGFLGFLRCSIDLAYKGENLRYDRCRLWSVLRWIVS